MPPFVGSVGDLVSAFTEGGGGGGGDLPVLETYSTNTESGNTTSHSTPAPSGITDGDLLVLVIGCGRSRTITPPSGFSMIAQETTSDYIDIQIFSKVASSESGDYSWSASANMRSASMMLRVSGTDTVNIYDGDSTTSNVDDFDAPAVTTTENNCLVFRVFQCGYDSLSGFTVPSTEVATIGTSGANGNGTTLSVSEEDKVTAGDTGTANFAYTASPDFDMGAITIAFEPA